MRTRRKFLAALLAAPVACVAALKAKIYPECDVVPVTLTDQHSIEVRFWPNEEDPLGVLITETMSVEEFKARYASFEPPPGPAEVANYYHDPSRVAFTPAMMAAMKEFPPLPNFHETYRKYREWAPTLRMSEPGWDYEPAVAVSGDGPKSKQTLKFL